MEMEETAKTDIESERQCVCVWLSNVTGFGEISLATLQDGVKKLWPFRTGRLSIPQNFGLTLANVKLNWAIYHC